MTGVNLFGQPGDGIIQLHGVDYKGILARISGFQTHLNELSKSLSEYNAKHLQSRDKTDELAKCLIKYRQFEPFEITSQYAVSIAAEILGKVGNHQTAAVLRLEKNVLPCLSTYKSICKCLQTDIRSTMAAESKVLAKQKLVNTFNRKANSDKYRGVTSDAEKQLENAIAESSRLNSLSQEQINKFEHKRLIDLKESLESFFKIEIAKHAKCLELVTEGYKFIHSIDESSDLDILRKRMNLDVIKRFNYDEAEGEMTRFSENSENENFSNNDDNSSWHTQDSEDDTDDYRHKYQQKFKKHKETKIESHCNNSRISRSEMSPTASFKNYIGNYDGRKSYNQTSPQRCPNIQSVSAISKSQFRSAYRSRSSSEERITCKTSEKSIRRTISTTPSQPKHQKNNISSRSLNDSNNKKQISRPKSSPAQNSKHVTFNDGMQTDKSRRKHKQVMDPVEQQKQERHEYLKQNDQYWNQYKTSSKQSGLAKSFI